METYHGGCHCEQVRFEVDAPDKLTAVECNCSICQSAGYLHLIVDAQRFRLLQGQDNLTKYQFNTRTAIHYFCRACGIKSFYIPRSHPNGYSVNVRCLDNINIDSVSVKPFDGSNWERSIDTLKSAIDTE